MRVSLPMVMSTLRSLRTHPVHFPCFHELTNAACSPCGGDGSGVNPAFFGASVESIEKPLCGFAIQFKQVRCLDKKALSFPAEKLINSPGNTAHGAARCVSYPLAHVKPIHPILMRGSGFKPFTNHGQSFDVHVSLLRSVSCLSSGVHALEQACVSFRLSFLIIDSSRQLEAVFLSPLAEADVV